MGVSKISASCACLACFLPALALCGCGTSDYNSLVNRAAASLRAGVKFQGLYAPTTIPDTPFSIRVPVIFSSSYTASSGHPDDGDKVDPLRLRPPFLPPDESIKLTYEGMYKTPEGKKLPYYCYLAVEDSKPGDADKLVNEFESGLKKAIPENAPTFEPVDADTPTGKAIHWRKIRAVFPQQFLVKVDGKVEKQMLPGVFEMWLHDADDKIVVIAWRAPSEIEGPQTEDFTEVNGIAVAADNPKPDFEKWPLLTAGTLEGQTGG